MSPITLQSSQYLLASPFFERMWKAAIFMVLFILLSSNLFSQGHFYFQKVKEGEMLFSTGKYTESANCYSNAFKSAGWAGYLPDRLNAARAWAMAGVLDSAFFNLFRVAEKLDYGNKEELHSDRYFHSMRSDRRWTALCERVEKNSYSYQNKVLEGATLYNKGNYPEAAKCYSDAFRAVGWQGSTTDRLNAARAWAMTGILDSAYFHLNKIAENGEVDNLEAYHAYQYYWEALETDEQFQSLRSEARWSELCDRAKAHIPTMPELAKTLEKVLETDQQDRLKIDSISAQFGHESEQMTQLRKIIGIQDSINLDIVMAVLEKYGWLGKKEIGWAGTLALFLVIQHAHLEVQEKYLPLFRDAVSSGDANGAHLATLEDRVLERNGKKQLYGTQVMRNPVSDEIQFYPIEDVDNVEVRRSSVGLGPLTEYARHFGIIWDAEAIEKNKKMIAGPPEKK